jgi:hypothetical protein
MYAILFTMASFSIKLGFGEGGTCFSKNIMYFLLDENNVPSLICKLANKTNQKFSIFSRS